MLDFGFIKEKFTEGILDTTLEQGQLVLKVKPEVLHGLLRFCKEDPRLDCNFLMDVIAVDYLGQIPRFEVVYILYSLAHRHRLRVRVRLEEGQALPSATDLYLSADWAEREVWDMMGIRFTGHPELKRILLFEGFEGHALRKDYAVDRRQKIPVIEKNP